MDRLFTQENLKILSEIFEDISQIFPEIRFISVGSGNGKIEHQILLKTGIDIICVDPNPMSWCKDKTLYKAPEYSYIQELNESFIGNCILFINWSTPLTDGNYDIDAIEFLQPVSIITVVETGVYRAAGSPKLHNFLSRFTTTLGHYTDSFIQKNDLNGLKIVDPNSMCNFMKSYYLFQQHVFEVKNTWQQYPLEIKFLCLVECLDTLVSKTDSDQSFKSMMIEQTRTRILRDSEQTSTGIRETTTKQACQRIVRKKLPDIIIYEYLEKLKNGKEKLTNEWLLYIENYLGRDRTIRRDR